MTIYRASHPIAQTLTMALYWSRQLDYIPHRAFIKWLKRLHTLAYIQKLHLTHTMKFSVFDDHNNLPSTQFYLNFTSIPYTKTMVAHKYGSINITMKIYVRASHPILNSNYGWEQFWVAKKSHLSSREGSFPQSKLLESFLTHTLDPHTLIMVFVKYSLPLCTRP